MTLSQHRPGVAPRAPATTGLGHGHAWAHRAGRTFVTCLRCKLGADAKTLLAFFADLRNGCRMLKSGGQWRRNIGRVMKTSEGYGREGADGKALVTLAAARTGGGHAPCGGCYGPRGSGGGPVDPVGLLAAPANATSTNSASSSSRLTIFRASAGIKSSPSSPKAPAHPRAAPPPRRGNSAASSPGFKASAWGPGGCSDGP